MSWGRTTVILFFNKPALTKRCLDSVCRARAAAENSAPSERIILVDNGSRDECAREVAAMASARANVDLVRAETNVGFAKGMNLGLRAAFERAPGSPVLLLSNDVELPEDFYRTLEGQAPAPNNCATIWCPTVYFLSDPSKPAYTHGRVDVQSWELSHHFEPAREELRFPEYYPAAATLWTPEAYARLGGFNERYFCYWEDVELSWRALQKDVRLRRLPQAVVHHQGRGTTGGKDSYFQHFLDGRKLTMEIISQRV